MRMARVGGTGSGTCGASGGSLGPGPPPSLGWGGRGLKVYSKSWLVGICNGAVSDRRIVFGRLAALKAPLEDVIFHHHLLYEGRR